MQRIWFFFVAEVSTTPRPIDQFGIAPIRVFFYDSFGGKYIPTQRFPTDRFFIPNSLFHSLQLTLPNGIVARDWFTCQTIPFLCYRVDCVFGCEERYLITREHDSFEFLVFFPPSARFAIFFAEIIFSPSFTNEHLSNTFIFIHCILFPPLFMSRQSIPGPILHCCCHTFRKHPDHFQMRSAKRPMGHDVRCERLLNTQRYLINLVAFVFVNYFRCLQMMHRSRGGKLPARVGRQHQHRCGRHPAINTFQPSTLSSHQDSTLFYGLQLSSRWPKKVSHTVEENSPLFFPCENPHTLTPVLNDPLNDRFFCLRPFC